ncbi:MAG: hypothetical protein QXP70_01870 [Methanomassiliicoccales archaeon]
MKAKYIAMVSVGLGFLMLSGAGLALAATGQSGGGTPITVTVNPGTIIINSFGLGQNVTGTTTTFQQISSNIIGTSGNVQPNNTASDPYLLWVNVTDTSGYIAVQNIQVYMHYLDGSRNAAYNSTAGANMNIYLSLENTTLSGAPGYTARMLYPYPTVVNGVYPTARVIGKGGYYKYYNTTTANFTFDLYLGSQIHNATGPSSVHTASWAWEINVTAQGDGAIAKSTAGQNEYFGVNDFESVTVSSSSLSGNGAPSSTQTYGLGQMTLHYAVNNNYTLTLEATNLSGTIGSNTYTFLRHNIGIYVNGALGQTYNGTDQPSAYYLSSEPTSTTSFPKIGYSNGEARPFNDTTGPSPGQVSLFGAANVSFAPAQQSGVWESITISFVFQVPIGTVAATYTGQIVWRIWTQDQTFP